MTVWCKLFNTAWILSPLPTFLSDFNDLCYYFVIIWLLFCQYFVIVLLLFSYNVYVTLLLFCYYFVNILLLFCYCFLTMLMLLCYYFVISVAEYYQVTLHLILLSLQEMRTSPLLRIITEMQSR